MIDIIQVVVPRYVAYHVQVIAMKKGNPKNITSITDLTRDGPKIALGDVNVTAIGKVTANFSNGSLSLYSLQERYVTHGISFSYLISFALRISPLDFVLYHLACSFLNGRKDSPLRELLRF